MKKIMSKIWEKKNSKKGFTLVELIVVLVILAILMAIMIPAMTGWINKAKEQQNDMTGRAAMLAVQSAGAEKLKTKNAIPEFSDADGVTNAEMQDYLKDTNVELTDYTVTDNVRITEVKIKIDGTEFTYPR